MSPQTGRLWRGPLIAALALLIAGPACIPEEEPPEPTDDDDGPTPPLVDGEGVITERPSSACVDPVGDGERGGFTDVTEQAAVDFATASLPLDELEDSNDSIGISLLGGFTVSDLNGDGHLDLLFTDKDAPPRFFLGDGDFGFTAVDATTAGLPSGDALIGASTADLDGDRRLDLYLLGERNYMLISSTDGTFTDVTDARGLGGGDELSVSASWCDYDRDGDLDIFVANHGPGLATAGENVVPPDRDQFFVQQADGSFEDHIDSLYPVEDDGFGFIGGWFDADGDTWPDLYVANAAGGTSPLNVFMRNQGEDAGGNEPRLEEDPEAGLRVALLSMGLGLGDMDNDGDMDLHVTDAGQSFLARNDGQGLFVDISLELADFYGPTTGEMAWATDFFDYDNDGNLEIFTMFGAQPNKIGGGPNGIDNRLDQRDQMFARKDGEWFDIAPELGIDDPRIGRTEVPADIDRDGTLDLVTWRLLEGPRVYRAQCHDRGWLLVALDQPETLNRFGVGARLEVWSGDEFLAMRELSPGSTGLFSSGPAEVHFGLGDHDEVDLVVRWPGGYVTRNDGVETRRAILVTR